MNVLLTSCSGKVSMYKCIKDALNRFNSNALLFIADSKENVLLRYISDLFWKMPTLDELSVQQIVKFCNDNKISVIIPSRDGELLFWAKIKNELLSYGIHVMVSDYEVIEICLDKLRFYNELKAKGFPSIPTYSHEITINEGKWVVKERFGAGAKTMLLNVCKKDAISHGRMLENPIFQPYIKGDEYSVDVYVNKTGVTVGAIVRKRELVINGESQVTFTCKDDKIENTCMELAKCLNIIGHAVIQILKDENNKLYIIECNSRFGGASSLSVNCGLDSFYWYLSEINTSSFYNFNFKKNKSTKKQIRIPFDIIKEI